MGGLIFLYPLFFLIVYLRGKDKKNHKLFNMIILIYFFAGLAASFIYYNLDYYRDTQLNLWAICYHLALMFLLLIPLRRFDQRADMPLVDLNQVSKIFTIGVIICSIIYIIDGIQYVDIYTILNDVSSLRADLNEGENRTGNALIGYIAYFYTTLSVAPLVLMFYYLIKSPERKVLIFILLICSLGTVIVELRFAAREFLIKYVYLAFCLFFILRKKFSIRTKKTIITGGIVLFSIILAIFLFITFLRFGDRSDTSTSLSMLNYFGQGFVNFSEGFVTHPDGVFPQKGTGTFPFFAGATRSHFNVDDLVNSSLEMNVFRTIIGSWQLDCGIYWTVLITIIYAFLFNIIGRNRFNNIFSYIYMALVFDFSFSLLFFFHENITGTRLVTYAGLVFIDYLSRPKSKVPSTNRIR